MDDNARIFPLRGDAPAPLHGSTTFNPYQGSASTVPEPVFEVRSVRLEINHVALMRYTQTVQPTLRRRQALAHAVHNYKVHAALAAVFDTTLRPFRLEQKPHANVTVVTGYTALTLEDLHDAVDFAEPHVQPVVVRDSICVTELPPLPQGKVLGFDATVWAASYCKGVKGRRCVDYDLGRDATPDQRAQRYLEWAKGSIHGAVLRNLTVTTHTVQTWNGDTKRTFWYSGVAEYRGVLEVAHEPTFRRFLVNGFGRMRHLGYGHVRLIPAHADV